LSGDERIRDLYLGGGEHGDEMTFGDRPLSVDSRRRSNVSIAQEAAIPGRLGEWVKSSKAVLRSSPCGLPSIGSIGSIK
jgi:hypothetical protein